MTKNTPLRGKDEVRGADGYDNVDGGRKNDWLKAVDVERDRVNCGHDDKAYVDEIERVNKDCEVVKKYDEKDYDRKKD